MTRTFMERDRVLNGLGMVVEEVRPGYARLSLAIADGHLNAFDKVHGGVTFTLGDQAFGFACNSHDVPAMAEQCSITYAAPAKAGDVLTAVAEEVLRRRRSAVYDVTVTDQAGVTVAIMRCSARATSEQPFPPA
ncbi:MAG: hotdog fold thioesterase [Alphaproteobacteria bacterium]